VNYLATYLRPPAPDTATRPDTALVWLSRQPSQQRPDSAEPDEIPDPDERVDDGTDGGDGKQSDQPHAETGSEDSLPDGVPVPTTRARYQRWRDLWHKVAELPSDEVPAFAQSNNVSVRTLQRIRQAGEAGLLDEIGPPSRRSRLQLVDGPRDG
jgi:hypothetical protein